MLIAILAVALLAVALLILLLWRFLPAYLRFRGTRVITCPETQQTVAVEVDAREAARTSVTGHPQLQLQKCTRWPERADCGQECLTQVEDSPSACLLRTMVLQWYEGKTCVFCGTVFGRPNWYAHRPAVVDSQHRTHEWSEFAPEKLPEILATHEPICWDCHVVETMIRDHPDRVTFRP